MIFLYAILILLAIYIIFIICPTIVMFFSLFSRKKGITIEDLEKSDDLEYYEPYIKTLSECNRFMKSLNYETVQIFSYDGVSLCAEYYDNGSDKTIIFVHGYCATPMSNFCVQARNFYQKDWNLLMVYQRGHSKSGGKHVTLGITEQYDILRWIDWASQKENTKNIVLYGISMGCTSIAYASDKIKNKKVKAMVLDCGFTSVYDQMKFDSNKRHLPTSLIMPYIQLFARMAFKENIKDSTCDSLRHTDIPAFFLHGAEDKSVPIECSKQMYKACASYKECEYPKNAHHILSFLAGKDVPQKLDIFLNRFVK